MAANTFSTPHQLVNLILTYHNTMGCWMSHINFGVLPPDQGELGLQRFGGTIFFE